MNTLVLQIGELIENLPLPTIADIILFCFGILLGTLAPTYYAAERLRGFARAMFERLPYKPPPGKEKEEALIEAIDSEVDRSDLEEEE